MRFSRMSKRRRNTMSLVMQDSMVRLAYHGFTFYISNVLQNVYMYNETIDLDTDSSPFAFKTGSVMI